jgi:hypothetical protein
MSEQPDTFDPDVTTMPCRVCKHDVPAAKFCGRCGAYLTHSRGDGPDWLRVGDYAAAPGENVLQPSVISSMFPHLPNRSQGAFRVGLLSIIAVLVVLCVLRMPLPMVVVSAFAPMLLFVAYLVETGVFADLPRWLWSLTVVLGLAVGVAWAMLTTSIVTESYSLGLGSAVPTAELVRDAVILPFGGLLAMQLPTVLIRLTRPPGRDSLYGFAIGALGATTFTLGATLVRLVPQLPGAMGPADQTAEDLLLEAGVRAGTMPLTAAAVGGLFGAGLWYARQHDHNRRGLPVVSALGVLSAAALYAIVGLIDVYRVAPNIQFVIHIALALTAVLALRFGLQLAMLHEPHESLHPESPILCPDCGHVVPDMAFCPACGVAAQAASRTSREARRLDRPQPDEEATGR